MLKSDRNEQQLNEFTSLIKEKDDQIAELLEEGKDGCESITYCKHVLDSKNCMKSLDTTVFVLLNSVPQYSNHSLAMKICLCTVHQCT